MKLVNLAMLLGAGLILLPPALDLDLNKWIYYLMCLLGALLCSISGYSAQASAVGMGETGEALLQSAWRWFRVKVLGHRLPPQVHDMSSEEIHQSIIPRPPRSPLSRWTLICGIAFVFMPSLLGWPSSNAGRLFAIGWGSLLIVASQRNLPPAEPGDPPHGREMLEVAWSWITRRLFGQP